MFENALKRDFKLFSRDFGVSSNTLDEYGKYIVKSSYINPAIIEERQLNCSVIDIFSRLLMDRLLFLGTEINSDVANILSAQLLWLEQQSNNDIHFYINTPGGSVYDGFQIIDTMNFINSSVSTTCLGMAASMGAVIFSNGEKGKRFIIPHGRMMIHQPLGGTGRSTQCSDIQIMAKEINTLKKELYEILSENSNLSYEKIEEMSDRDNWIKAEEAISYGFADSIIERKKLSI